MSLTENVLLTPAIRIIGSTFITLPSQHPLRCLVFQDYIIYSLNPVDNASIGTIIGCFQDPTMQGKVQQGSAWWFNDHKVGMTEQMTSLANLGCLGNFIGMLTDSRSFLSYTRHEYFRRVMCELIGGWVENGEYPADMKSLKEIVEGISYNNTVKYFKFDL